VAHTTLRTSYSALTDRLNRYPQGAPPSDLLFKILSMLFSEEEAGLVSLMPIKPFTAEKASRIWKKNLTETQNILDELADRAILVDFEQNGETVYALPPPMAGFFEFSLMRVRDDIDRSYLLVVKRSWGEPSYVNLLCPMRMHCMCWIMNGPAK
jgi:hypothetical protein